MGTLIFVTVGFTSFILFSILSKKDVSVIRHIVASVILGVLCVSFGTYSGCADGWLSTNIGKQGACSHHGGVKSFINLYGTIAMGASIILLVLTILVAYLKSTTSTNDNQLSNSSREGLIHNDDEDQPKYDNLSFRNNRDSQISSSVELILYCPESYYDQRKIEEMIISFITKNFWYYLNQLKQKSILNELTTAPISSSLIVLINEESMRNIEFPNVNHRKRGGGIVPNSWNNLIKPEKHENQRSELPISDELNDAIFRSINSRIIGEVLVLFSDTSIGELIGYRTNRKLAIY